ncbi:hypothetical protein PF008_g1816 [Phytophthora fragariae]|nr:hypothetical protein PF008_g1816 [Phytophthora fragariae]
MSTKNAVKCGVDKLMLSATEAMELSKLVKVLTKLDSVTIALQDEELTTLQVRDLFDHTIAKYPIMRKYLSANAASINKAPFERALVKLQSGRKLTPVEREASAMLLAPAVEETSLSEEDSESEETFAQQALKRRRLAGPADIYIDTGFVPPTSNICERLFSQSNLVLSDQRRALRPATLEMLVFLRANRDLW